MHTPTVKADLSDSMKTLVQLAKKFGIQICHVFKQNKGVQIADSPEYGIDGPYINQVDYGFKT